MPQDDIVTQVLLGEAAGEGPEGLAFVLDTIVNRARRQGKTLEEIVSQPKQFSAFARPDLAEFANNQPLAVRVLTQQLVDAARKESYTPSHDVENYVTTDLFARRNEPGVASWIRQMEPALTVGSHVGLRPRRQSDPQ